MNLDKTKPWWALFSSLKARIVLSALLLVVVLMPLIGFALTDAFTQQAKSAGQNELSAYIYSILAVTEVENNALLMPEALLENKFNLINSGLYVLITNNDKSVYSNTLLWQSPSFLGLTKPSYLPVPDNGTGIFSEVDLDGQQHLVYSFSASFEQNKFAFPVTIHIIKNQSEFKQQVDVFSSKLWQWLFILTIVLMLVQLAWLVWTLRPLARFKQELERIEQGAENALNGRYPNELDVVAKQLNTLLKTEQSQRKRYRNALSDLAHSLKTPLAVMQSQGDLSPAAIEQVSIINKMIGHQLKRAQSSAGSSWHLGIKVSQVSEPLLRALAKIYPDITIKADIDPDAIFKGDEADLAEILGNILDNACKAATKNVILMVVIEDENVVIIVEDDGPGIDEKLEKEIFKRGIRADSYQKGHGIGLAIVRDLTKSYQGKLQLSRSKTLGGAKFTFHFQA